MRVLCPYCGKRAKLVDSATIYFGHSFGFLWDCRPCDAYVGTHKNSKQHAPLGTLANAELRVWRQRAHAAFDPPWKSGALTRAAAYTEMQRILGIGPDEAHIAKLDVAQCQRLVTELLKGRPHEEQSYG